jgi:hypothetical protein
VPFDLAEPGAVGRVVQGPLEPTGNLGPQGLCSQLNRLLHPRCPAPPRRQRGPSIATCLASYNGLFRRVPVGEKQWFCRDFPPFHIALHRCGQSVSKG